MNSCGGAFVAIACHQLGEMTMDKGSTTLFGDGYEQDIISYTPPDQTLQMLWYHDKFHISV
jgi:hypothetical protein